MELKHGKKMREWACTANYENFFAIHIQKALSGLRVEQIFPIFMKKLNIKPTPPNWALIMGKHPGGNGNLHLLKALKKILESSVIWVKMQINKNVNENSKIPRITPECSCAQNSSQWSKQNPAKVHLELTSAFSRRNSITLGFCCYLKQKSSSYVKCWLRAIGGTKWWWMLWEQGTKKNKEKQIERLSNHSRLVEAEEPYMCFKILWLFVNVF